MRINFNVPPFTGKEMDYIKICVENQKICGDGEYTKKDNEWFEKKMKNVNPSHCPMNERSKFWFKNSVKFLKKVT